MATSGSAFIGLSTECVLEARLRRRVAISWFTAVSSLVTSSDDFSGILLFLFYTFDM